MNWFKRIFGRDEFYTGHGHYASGSEMQILDLAHPGINQTTSHPHFRNMDGPFEDIQTLEANQVASQSVAPFLPSHPVSTVFRFAGRKELLRRVIRAIEDQQLHVIVYGDRGIGKTSLLRVVGELAEQADYSVHYESCGEDADFSDTFRTVLSRIPLLYDASLDPGVEAVLRGGTLADKLPAGHFSAPRLIDVLSCISGAKVLVILDEFDRAKDPRFSKSVAELIKNLSDRSIPVQILIGGVSSSLPGLISDVPSIRRNVVGFSVPNMDAEEIRDLIDIGARRGELTFAESALKRLVEASAGLPYLGGLLAQYGSLEAIAEGPREVKARHIERAIELAKEDIASRLSPRAQRVFSDPELCGRKALITMAAAEAVRNGGMIRDSALVAALEQEKGPVANIFEAIPEDPWQAWRFTEDGASNLAWLMSL